MRVSLDRHGGSLSIDSREDRECVPRYRCIPPLYGDLSYLFYSTVGSLRAESCLSSSYIFITLAWQSAHT